MQLRAIASSIKHAGSQQNDAEVLYKGPKMSFVHVAVSTSS